MKERLKWRKTSTNLETNVDVGSIDSWRPPKREAAVGDLIETGSLGVGQLLVFHGFFKTGSFFPKQAFPSGEVGTLEERVLKNAFHTTQSLDHVRAVVIQVPQLAIVTLVGPPERVLLQHLEIETERRGVG